MNGRRAWDRKPREKQASIPDAERALVGPNPPEAELDFWRGWSFPPPGDMRWARRDG